MVPVNVGFEQQKVVGCGKDGGRKRDLVSKGHRDKQLGESILIEFDSKEVLSVRKTSVSYNYKSL